MTGMKPTDVPIADGPDWIIDLLRCDAHDAAIKREYTGGGIDNSADIKVDPFGRVIDGRDTYMRNLIWHELIGFIEKDAVPDPDMLAKHCWPLFEANAMPRGESLEADGHTIEVMLAKCRSTLHPEKIAKARLEAKPQTTADRLPAAREVSAANEVSITEATPIATTMVEEYGKPEFSLPDGVFGLDELEKLPDPQYLIEELIAVDSLSIVYGKWGSFKSFVAIDMGLALAYGLRDWHGQRSEQAPVMYACGEGKSGIKARVAAWRRHNDVTDLWAPFYVETKMPALMVPEDAQRLVDRIFDVPIKPKVLILDTVSRALAGHEENDAAAMGGFIKVVDHIRETCDLSIILIHHEGKNQDAGPRGSSVLPAAADTMIQCKKVNGRWLEATVTKQKDAEEIPLPVFDMLPTNTGHMKRMIPTQSLVMVPQSANGSLRNEAPTTRLADEILHLIDARWHAGRPLSGTTSDPSGNAVKVICKQFDVTDRAAKTMIKNWQSAGVLIKSRTQRNGKDIKGWEVVKRT